MKNKKAKFSSQKATLILLQHLQAKYFGNVNASIDIDVLASNSMDVWIGKGEGLVNIIFSNNDTAETRKRQYDELLNLINNRL